MQKERRASADASRPSHAWANRCEEVTVALMRASYLALGSLITGLSVAYAVAPGDLRLLSVHEVVHLCLLLVAPPLLLANSQVARWIRGMRLAAALNAFGLYAAVVIVAHAPPIDLLTLQIPALHVVAHGALLFAGLLFWTQIIGARALSFPLRIAALLVATGLHALVGAALAFTGRPLYDGYLPTGSDAVSDQALAGVVFWIPPKLFFIGVITVLFWRWLEREDQNPHHLQGSDPPGLPAWRDQEL